MLACALRKIKHSVCGLNANKTLSFTLCFISIFYPNAWEDQRKPLGDNQNTTGDN